MNKKPIFSDRPAKEVSEREVLAMHARVLRILQRAVASQPENRELVTMKENFEEIFDGLIQR